MIDAEDTQLSGAGSVLLRRGDFDATCSVC